MAFIPLPLGVRVSLEFNYDGEVVVNIYHVLVTGPITTIKLNAVAQAFIDWWKASLADLLTDNIAVTGATALNLDEESGEKVYVPEAPQFPGGSVSPAMPNNIALVVSHRTSKTGRSFQGRSYVAGLTENIVVDNDVTVGYASQILAAYVDLFADLNAAQASLVVASFQSEGAPRVTGVATLVDSFAVGLRVDTQRRRLPNRP